MTGNLSSAKREFSVALHAWMGSAAYERPERGGKVLKASEEK